MQLAPLFLLMFLATESSGWTVTVRPNDRLVWTQTVPDTKNEHFILTDGETYDDATLDRLGSLPGLLPRLVAAGEVHPEMALFALAKISDRTSIEACTQSRLRRMQVAHTPGVVDLVFARLVSGDVECTRWAAAILKNILRSDFSDDPKFFGRLKDIFRERQLCQILQSVLKDPQMSQAHVACVKMLENYVRTIEIEAVDDIIATGLAAGIAELLVSENSALRDTSGRILITLTFQAGSDQARELALFPNFLPSVVRVKPPSLRTIRVLRNLTSLHQVREFLMADEVLDTLGEALVSEADIVQRESRITLTNLSRIPSLRIKLRTHAGISDGLMFQMRQKCADIEKLVQPIMMLGRLGVNTTTEEEEECVNSIIAKATELLGSRDQQDSHSAIRFLNELCNRSPPYDWKVRLRVWIGRQADLYRYTSRILAKGEDDPRWSDAFELLGNIFAISDREDYPNDETLRLLGSRFVSGRHLPEAVRASLNLSRPDGTLRLSSKRHLTDLPGIWQALRYLAEPSSNEYRPESVCGTIGRMLRSSPVVLVDKVLQHSNLLLCLLDVHISPKYNSSDGYPQDILDGVAQDLLTLATWKPGGSRALFRELKDYWQSSASDQPLSDWVRRVFDPVPHEIAQKIALWEQAGDDAHYSELPAIVDID